MAEKKREGRNEVKGGGNRGKWPKHLGRTENKFKNREMGYSFTCFSSLFSVLTTLTSSVYY